MDRLYPISLAMFHIELNLVMGNGPAIYYYRRPSENTHSPVKLRSTRKLKVVVVKVLVKQPQIFLARHQLESALTFLRRLETDHRVDALLLHRLSRRLFLAGVQVHDLLHGLWCNIHVAVHRRGLHRNAYDNLWNLFLAFHHRNLERSVRQADLRPNVGQQLWRRGLGLYHLYLRCCVCEFCRVLREIWLVHGLLLAALRNSI